METNLEERVDVSIANFYSYLHRDLMAMFDGNLFAMIVLVISVSRLITFFFVARGTFFFVRCFINGLVSGITLKSKVGENYVSINSNSKYVTLRTIRNFSSIPFHRNKYCISFCKLFCSWYDISCYSSCYTFSCTLCSTQCDTF